MGGGCLSAVPGHVRTGMDLRHNGRLVPGDGDIITMVHFLVQDHLCGHWDPVTDSVDLGFSRYCVEVAGMQFAIHCQEMTLLNEKPW